MNPSDFMNKRVLGLSKSIFFDSDDDDESGEDDDDHTLGLNKNSDSTDHMVSAELTEQRSSTSSRAILISKIDSTIKEHVKYILHAIEGVSARIMEFESKTHHLEQTMDDLKATAEFIFAGTEGNMRHIENILREVHHDVHYLSDKQEIAEAQLLLENLQLSRSKIPLENRNTEENVTPASAQTISSLSFSSPLPHVNQPSPPLHPPLPPQGMTVVLPQVQISSMLHQASNLPYLYSSDYMTSLHFIGSPSHMNPLPRPPAPHVLSPEGTVQTSPPPVQSSSASHTPQGNLPNLQFPDSVTQQYYLPPIEPQDPLSYAIHNFHASQLTEVSPIHPSVVETNPQYPSPLCHQLLEMPYVPSNAYPSCISQSPRTTGRAPSSELMFDTDFSKWRFSYGFSSTGDPDFPHQYGSSHPISSRQKDSQFSSPIFLPSSRSSQPQLTTQKPLPYALPIVSTSDHGLSSDAPENNVSVDDVLGKIATMGFRRDLAKEVVRKLKDSGQSVDLNSVLDKLTSDKESQVQRVER